MLKLAAGVFVAAWLLFALIVVSGHLIWSNRLLWGPFVLLMLTAYIAPTAAFEQQDRTALLLLGAVAFCCVLAYVVFYVFFLFGLVGH